MIGVSVGFHDFGDYTGVGVQRPIALAGGLPLTLTRLDDVFEETLDLLDGVVLGGGRDIEPHRYGQERHELVGPADPHRDDFELRLVERALARGLPLLGTCRGMQLLNVALGGTLVQDVALVEDWAGHPSDRGWHRWREVEHASLHDRPDVPEHPRHPMRIEPGSRLHAALGVTGIEVNSFHHQAVDRVARRLRVTGVAEDGVPEVLELEGEPFVLAAQFELHEEWRVERRFLEIFRAFVTAAVER